MPVHRRASSSCRSLRKLLECAPAIVVTLLFICLPSQLLAQWSISESMGSPPNTGSYELSAVLSKVAAYGFLRVVLPIYPDATEDIPFALSATWAATSNPSPQVFLTVKPSGPLGCAATFSSAASAQAGKYPMRSALGR